MSMEVGHGSLAQLPGLAVGHGGFGKSRHFIRLNGVDMYYPLRDADDNPISMNVDQIRMLVCPVSGGNAGLPDGCPVLTDGVLQEVDFSHSGQLSEIGRVGTDYFNGYIANLVLLFDNEIIYSNPLNSDLSSAQLTNRIPVPEA